MTMPVTPQGRIGQYIRGTHSWVFRTGEWALITDVVEYKDRACWSVQFRDSTTDLWPCDDALAGYEFERPLLPDEECKIRMILEMVIARDLTYESAAAALTALMRRLNTTYA